MATHVGSLVRPPGLINCLRAMDNGVTVDGDAYQRCLSESVAEVVEKQVETGIDIVSDGEYGKGIGWEQYVIERLTGFGPAEPLDSEQGESAIQFKDLERFAEYYAEYWTTQELTAADIEYYVRNGVSVMPFFRKTEISVAERKALADYLSRSED